MQARAIVACMKSGTAIVHGTLGRPTWSADNHTIAVGSLFAFSDRYADGLNQLLLLKLEPTNPEAYQFSLQIAAADSTMERWKLLDDDYRRALKEYVEPLPVKPGSPTKPAS